MHKKADKKCSHLTKKKTQRNVKEMLDPFKEKSIFLKRKTTSMDVRETGIFLFLILLKENFSLKY